MAYTNKEVDHKQIVSETVKIRRKHNSMLDPEKSQFSRSKVKSMGPIISHNRIQMEPTKAKVVAKWKEWRTINELQQFLRFSNSYQ